MPLGISTTCRQCCFAVQSSKSNLVLMQICRVLSLCQKSERFIHQTANQLFKNYSSACSAPFPHLSIFVYLFIFLVLDAFDVMQEESSAMIKFVAGDCANSSDDSLAAVLTLDCDSTINNAHYFLVLSASAVACQQWSLLLRLENQLRFLCKTCRACRDSRANRTAKPERMQIKANSQLAFDCLCHHSFLHFNWIFDLISIAAPYRVSQHGRLWKISVITLCRWFRRKRDVREHVWLPLISGIEFLFLETFAMREYERSRWIKRDWRRGLKLPSFNYNLSAAAQYQSALWTERWFN